MRESGVSTICEDTAGTIGGILGIVGYMIIYIIVRLRNYSQCVCVWLLHKLLILVKIG